MTRELAIRHIEYGLEMETSEPTPFGQLTVVRTDALKMALSALRGVEQKQYTAHDVAVILAEFTGDDCACNFNGIDEWLPEKCELLDACPNTCGVACWEQYLKHR